MEERVSCSSEEEIELCNNLSSHLIFFWEGQWLSFTDALSRARAALCSTWDKYGWIKQKKSYQASSHFFCGLPVHVIHCHWQNQSELSRWFPLLGFLDYVDLGCEETWSIFSASFFCIRKKNQTALLTRERLVPNKTREEVDHQREAVQHLFFFK